ncbi:MAG: hypothetical protein HFG01_06575 [Oscillibacter sp.]|jgi:hypothetical protein|nr:hypothetical protein [Oscillibacter sp.]
MSFEAEVIPLFIGGCIAVSLLELAAGWVLFRGRKQAGALFTGHVASMAVGLFFLVRCIFGDRLGLTGPIASIDHSVSIGLFGLCWTASVLFLLSALGRLNTPDRETSEH